MNPATAAAVAGEQHGSVTGRPRWLLTDPEPIYTVLHTPPRAHASSLAVLIVPPFGWDNDCSYRRRRDWATALADSGITAARIDLPGTENSAGSPRGAGRVEIWIDAAIDAAGWLRQCSGCERLTVLGIGLGGLIASAAMARGADMDDLILWGVRASGRAYVRELRAFAGASGHGRADEVPHAARPEGAFGVGGHLMTDETAAALAAIDLRQLGPPEAARRRALLIDRDSNGVDPALRAHLEATGMAVSVLRSDEYNAMLSPPDLELTPRRTIDASIDWLRAGLGAPARPQTRAPTPRATTDRVTLAQDGRSIRERIVQLQIGADTVVGIISEPTTGPRADCCLVSVNSGALRHTGPNRLFVEIGRRAAAAGVPAARFDLPGLGDSDGDAVKSFERRAEDEPATLAAIRQIHTKLMQAGVAEHIIAGGFSLGGYLTTRLALTDPAPIAAISVNPTGFSWTVKQRQRATRDFMAMAGPDAVAPAAPRRQPSGLRTLAGRLEPRRRALEAKARRLLARSDLLWRAEHRRELADLSAGLERLAGDGTRMLLLLSQGEQLLRMLELPKLRAKLARCQNVEVEVLPDRDHLLRPLWVQQLATERFLAAVVEFSCSRPRRRGGISPDVPGGNPPAHD